MAVSGCWAVILSESGSSPVPKERPAIRARSRRRRRSPATRTGGRTSFAGSYVELSSFVGTGTFYVGGYHNPYVSNALYLKPIYQLGTSLGLTLSARVYLEAEYTQPDNTQARRFYPLDTWLTLAARNLYTGPRSKIRFAGMTRVVVPTSYESRYAHLLTGIGVGGSASRRSSWPTRRHRQTLGAGAVRRRDLHQELSFERAARQRPWRLDRLHGLRDFADGVLGRQSRGRGLRSLWRPRSTPASAR